MSDGSGQPQRDHPLFVYGTLKSDGGRQVLLAGRRRGLGWIRGRLYDLPAGYPAVDPCQDGRVHGEWLDPVPRRVLALLDAYEGVGEGLFRRELVEVHTDRSTFRAWAWVMDAPEERGGRYLPKGRWRAIRRRKGAV